MGTGSLDVSSYRQIKLFMKRKIVRGNGVRFDRDGLNLDRDGARIGKNRVGIGKKGVKSILSFPYLYKRLKNSLYCVMIKMMIKRNEFCIIIARYHIWSVFQNCSETDVL